MKWNEEGFYIIKGDDLGMKEWFEKHYKSRFTDDIIRNRSLIKCFGNEPAVIATLCDMSKLMSSMGMAHPVIASPVITHYTSMDKTGEGYGLIYHYDAATSLDGAIVWMPVTDVTDKTHGLKIKPMNGGEVQVEMAAGDVLVFHPRMEHMTYYNPNATDYRLAISQRFDDMESAEWDGKDFKSAYEKTFDRFIWSDADNKLEFNGGNMDELVPDGVGGYMVKKQ